MESFEDVYSGIGMTMVQQNLQKFALTGLQAVAGTYFGQLVLLVGGGLLSHSIAVVVGGESLTAWPTAVLGILVAALSRAAGIPGRGFLGQKMVPCHPHGCRVCGLDRCISIELHGNGHSWFHHRRPLMCLSATPTRGRVRGSPEEISVVGAG